MSREFVCSFSCSALYELPQREMHLKKMFGARAGVYLESFELCVRTSVCEIDRA